MVMKRLKGKQPLSSFVGESFLLFLNKLFSAVQCILMIILLSEMNSADCSCLPLLVIF